MITFGELLKDGEDDFRGEMYSRETGIIDVVFQKVPNAEGNQPGHIAFAYDDRKQKYYPIGKVWKPKPGKQHYFVKLESPLSPHNVIEASLFPDKFTEGKFNLIWYPPADNAPKANAEAKTENGAKAEAIETKPETETATQVKQPQKRSVWKGMSPRA